MTILDLERLDVFRVALELDELVVGVCVAGPGWLRVQAQRASGSVALNIAEALGRAGDDRRQRLRIARGSALEVGAALSLLGHRRIGTREQREAGAVLVARVVAMLVKMGAR